MKLYFSLTLMLLKNTIRPGSGDPKKRIRTILISFVIALSLIPFISGIVTITAAAYDVFVQFKSPDTIPLLTMMFMTVFVFFFGIIYVINIFCFSKETENLLPLPIKSWQIIFSKFTIAILYEYLTFSVLILPVFITYGVKGGEGVLYYLYTGIIFLLIPVIPLVIASIISLVIMRLTNISGFRDKFRIAAGALMLLGMLSLNIYMQNLFRQPENAKEVSRHLISGDSMNEIIASNLPHIGLALRSLNENENPAGLLNISLYVGVNAVALILFLLSGEVLYLRGVVGTGEIRSGIIAANKHKLRKYLAQSSVISSLFYRDLKLLFRTPAFFMNCVLINFLWPLIIFLTVFSSDSPAEFLRTIFLYPSAAVWGIWTAMGVMLAAVNVVAVTSLSREGKDLMYLKSLPLKFREIIISKIFPGMALALAGYILILVSLAVLFNPPYGLIAGTLPPVLSGMVLSSLTGILIDLHLPKLGWHSEYEPVKHNFNLVMSMIVNIVFSGLFIFIISGIGLTLWSAYFFCISSVLLINILLWNWIIKKGERLFSRIEL